MIEVSFVYLKSDVLESMDSGGQKLQEIHLQVIVGSSPKLFSKIGISISQNTSNQLIEKKEKYQF